MGVGQLGSEAGRARWEVEWAFGPESRGEKGFSLFFSFLLFVFFSFISKTYFKTI